MWKDSTGLHLKLTHPTSVMVGVKSLFLEMCCVCGKGLPGGAAMLTQTASCFCLCLTESLWRLNTGFICSGPEGRSETERERERVCGLYPVKPLNIWKQLFAISLLSSLLLRASCSVSRRYDHLSVNRTSSCFEFLSLLMLTSPVLLSVVMYRC